MSRRLHYVKTVRPEVLLEELQTALPALAPQPGPSGENVPRMALEATATECWVTVPDATVTADVDAVVAAHDPDRVTPGDVQQVADRANLKALHQLVDQMVPRLDTIQQDMVILGQHATTLSTVTVTNIAQVQNTLRAVGADLIAYSADTKDLATVSERTLKALDSIIRQLYGPQEAP